MLLHPNIYAFTFRRYKKSEMKGWFHQEQAFPIVTKKHRKNRTIQKIHDRGSLSRTPQREEQKMARLSFLFYKYVWNVKKKYYLCKAFIYPHARNNGTYDRH